MRLFILFYLSRPLKRAVTGHCFILIKCEHMFPIKLDGKDLFLRSEGTKELQEHGFQNWGGRDGRGRDNLITINSLKNLFDLSFDLNPFNTQGIFDGVIRMMRLTGSEVVHMSIFTTRTRSL